MAAPGLLPATSRDTLVFLAWQEPATASHVLPPVHLWRLDVGEVRRPCQGLRRSCDLGAAPTGCWGRGGAVRGCVGSSGIRPEVEAPVDSHAPFDRRPLSQRRSTRCSLVYVRDGLRRRGAVLRAIFTSSQLWPPPVPTGTPPPPARDPEAIGRDVERSHLDDPVDSQSVCPGLADGRPQWRVMHVCECLYGRRGG